MIAAEAKCQLASLKSVVSNCDLTGCERQVEWRYSTHNLRFTAMAVTVADKKFDKKA